MSFLLLLLPLVFTSLLLLLLLLQLPMLSCPLLLRHLALKKTGHSLEGIFLYTGVIRTMKIM
jgi:hypothetical protein